MELEGIKFDPAIKLRPLRVILECQNFDKYRREHRSIDISLAECKVILSSKETEEIIQELRLKKSGILWIFL